MWASTQLRNCECSHLLTSFFSCNPFPQPLLLQPLSCNTLPVTLLLQPPSCNLFLQPLPATLFASCNTKGCVSGVTHATRSRNPFWVVFHRRKVTPAPHPFPNLPLRLTLTVLTQVRWPKRVHSRALKSGRIMGHPRFSPRGGGLRPSGRCGAGNEGCECARGR